MGAPPLSDREVFLEAYRRNAEPLRRYAARVLGAMSAADDVVQETFTRAMAAAALPSEPTQARAYLFRIASNVMTDLWRRRRRELRHAEEEVETVTEQDPMMRLDLGRLFLRLGLRDRQLLWLAHVEGDDHAMIAAELGVGEASVKVLLHRARRKFAELLRQGGYDER